MDRICPPLKNRLVAFPLPPINTARDAADAMSAVMGAVAEGRLTPADAAEISKVVACAVKAFEAAEFADRSARIEELSDAELHRILAAASETNGRRLLTIDQG
jgi:hypothetical protein